MRQQYRIAQFFRLSLRKVALILAVLTLLSGCSAVMGGKLGSPDNDVVLSLLATSADSNVLKCILNGEKSSVFLQTSKIIAPTYDLANGLYLYLTGVSSLDGHFMGPLLIERNTITWSQANLKADVSIPSLTYEGWDLTLWVASSNTITDLTGLQSSAVLKGETHIDFTNTTIAHFNLATSGLTGTGGFSITVAGATGVPLEGFVSSTNQNTLEVRLTDMVTGAVIKATDGTALQWTNLNFFVTGGINPGGVAGPVWVESNQKNVSPGTYNLDILFQINGGTTRYMYSEILVVSPNMTTSKAVLVPDIFGQVTAPSNLLCYYVQSSENHEAGHYNVRFQWTDNSNNELGFELEVAEIASNITVQTLPANDAQWTLLVAGATVVSYGENSFETPTYSSGSTMPNSSELILRLQLGSRYLARIRAVGDGIYSSWSYMTFPTTAPAGYQNFPGTSINRYYICYNLRGGVYDSDGTGNADRGSTVDEIYYYYSHVNGHGTVVLAPSGGGRTTLPSLMLNGNISWSNWLYGTLTEYPGNSRPVDYTGHTNLILIASYGSSYPMENSWIQVNGKSVNPYPGATTDITKSANSNTLNITLNLPRDVFSMTDFVYDAVTVMFSWPDTHGPLFVFETITNMVAGQPLNFSLSTSGLSFGEYLMRIECRKGSSVSVFVSSVTLK